MARRRFLIIHNPDAGIAKQRLLARVIAQLDAEGASITTQIAEDVETDKRLAREAAETDSWDAVVAAGGDSTIRGVAAGLLGTPMPLGLLPVGTGNVMAEEIGLKRRADHVVRTLLTGTPTTVLGARANGEPFFLMAGAGFDGAVVQRLNQRLKRLCGKLAYAGPMLSTLAEPLPRLRVEVDDAAHEAAWVVVTNAGRYGGPFRLSSRASIHEAGLITVLFHPRSRTRLLAQLLAIARGTLEQAPDVTFLTSARTVVAADRPVPVQIDGESWGTTPLTVTPGNESVRVLMP